MSTVVVTGLAFIDPGLAFGVFALLLFHGDQDPQMPINQAHELEGAYEKAGLDVYLDVVHGAPHGGPMFFAPAHLDRALAFLRRTIGH